MNKRLAALFTVLTLAFMLGASAIARHGTANGVSSSGYPALSSAENTLCRVEHGAVQINVNAADEETLMLLDGGESGWDAPEGLRRVAMRAAQQERERRYASVTAFLSAWREAVREDWLY